MSRLPGPAAVAAALGLVALGGCSASPAPDPEPVLASVQWAEHQLPAPPGSAGRTVVRDAVACGGGWWVVGAVFLDHPTETRDTRPAAWFSADRETWRAVPVTMTTYWGRRAILGSVACSRGRVVAVGARAGGAHGNPRVTTFRPEGEGLVDVRTTFVQYGGVSATNVGPVSGGDAGWMIAGNRTSGPGIWVTDDPRGFTRVEGEPGLTDDGDLESLAQAAGWTGSEWVLVGAGSRIGHRLDQDPLAWTSPDGLAWTAQDVPAREGFEDLHRVVALDDRTVVAVGRSGDTFAAWLREDGTWSDAVAFGAISDDWRGTPYVASLARTPLGLLATLSTGDHYELWRSEDGRAWTRVEVPLEPPTAGDHTLVAAEGDELLLLGDAGDGGHVWSGTVVAR